jgi:ribosomal protein S9
MASETPIVATGRRKTAVASINVVSGKGSVQINGRDIEDYFTTGNMRTIALKPLKRMAGALSARPARSVWPFPARSSRSTRKAGLL